MPGHEGRAGMVAILKHNKAYDIDVDKLARHINEHLSKFARPVFLRIIHHEHDWEVVTGTLKLRKTELQR